MKNDCCPNIITIGASAGGVSALQKVVSGFPASLQAAVFVVLHLWPEAESLLPEILSRAGKLRAVHATDGAMFEPGKVYVAPPDRHLLLHDGITRVVRGPKENRHRPSIDVLFRSAAQAYGPRIVGVLLTGADDDGTVGLKDIQERGGVTIVQDPQDAEHAEMPRSALNAIHPDFTLPLGQIGPTVSDLVRGVVRTEKPAMAEAPDKSFGGDEGLPVDVARLGTPTAYSCPDCGGTLWELQDGELLRYRCRVGHAYSAGSMVRAQSDAVEHALWAALRVLEESASISRRIAEKNSTLRQELSRKAHEREEHAATIRNLLLAKTA